MACAVSGGDKRCSLRQRPADVGFEHQVEGARGGLFAMALGNHFARFCGQGISLVGRAETPFARLAINHRVAERVHVAAGLPDLRMHDDGGFETGDVVTLAGHGVPPEFLDIALEFGAERAVVPKSIDTAVNLGGLKNETAPLAQRHDFFP